MVSMVSIVPWRPAFAGAFRDINLAWISEMFEVEAHDLEMLDDPQGFIINAGGVILCAEAVDLGVVGTCALIPSEDGGLELSKMAVLAAARGQRIGEALLTAAIEKAAAMGHEPLFLLTNRRCVAAIRLYEKHGFQHDAGIMERYGASYARCDVAMRYVA
jgi:GNAT superfamily N-acetyltransferase